MKAVILCAGKGERLKPLTNNIPKPLLPIGGRPLLERHIERLKHYDVKEFLINLHYLPEKIIDYFQDGRSLGVSIKYYFEPKLLGTAGAIKSMQDELEDDNFFVVYGDNLNECNFRELKEYHERKRGIATIAIFKKKGELKESGVVLIDSDSRIIKFIEKPTEEELGNLNTKLVNAGIFVLSPEIFDFIPEDEYDFGRNLFPELIKKNKPLYAYNLNGVLIGIDTKEYYQRANDYFNKGE